MVYFKIAIFLLCSLPRHKISNTVKGFAFVEYSLAEEAQKAVEVIGTRLLS